MSSFKTGTKKLHPGHVLIGENGLPVDTVATIAGTQRIIIGDSPVTYSSGVITFPVGTDLSILKSYKPVYTGRLLFEDASGVLYSIEKNTINPIARTLVITNLDYTGGSPTAIDLGGKWLISEAEIVNRLATTSAAKIDQVEFRDVQFQLQLDGDPVTVQGKNKNTLEPNADGSLNIGGTVNVNADFTEVNSNLVNIDAELEQANATLDEIASNSAASSNSLDLIANTLSQPLAIQNPIVVAGTVNGDPNGAPLAFVNNIKNQILASSDRVQELIYADFGTKDQRIVEIRYSSATFPGVEAIKELSYTLVGSRYRRDTISWRIE